MKLDTPVAFSPITLVLHWLVGVSIIGLLGVGVYMEETETFSLYPLHKSFGFIIFFVVMLRVAWRIRNGWPVPLSALTSQSQRMQQALAKVVHYVLIIATVLMPLSGFLMSSLGGSGVDVFGLEVVARNIDPSNPGKSMPHNRELASFFHSAHGWIGKLLIAAVVLHIAGALKHHLIDKDGTLKRMLGQS
jgi:cytochrome b561